MDGGRRTAGSDVELSVVIPCRNAAATLGEQLEALTRQSFRGQWEVVVVDDGSTDETRAVAAGFSDRLPLVVVDAGEGHHSPARARNLGARVARGERILFCDSDDVVDDEWGSALERALDEHGFVCARRDVRRLNSRVEIESNRHVPDGPIRWWGDEFLEYTAGCVLGVRRNVHDAIGGFDESFLGLGEDFDYCWRIQIETGEALCAVPDAIVHYRFRVGLRPTFRQARNYGASNVAVYAKWRDELSVPEHQWSAGLWAWVRVLADLRRIRTRGRFGRWVWSLGLLVGYAQASARLSVLLLCPDAELARPPDRLMRR